MRKRIISIIAMSIIILFLPFTVQACMKSCQRDGPEGSTEGSGTSGSAAGDESFTFEVDDITVEDLEDGRVRVTIRDGTGREETLEFDSREDYDAFVSEYGLLKNGDKVTIETNPDSGETIVTIKKEDGTEVVITTDEAEDDGTLTVKTSETKPPDTTTEKEDKTTGSGDKTSKDETSSKTEAADETTKPEKDPTESGEGKTDPESEPESTKPSEKESSTEEKTSATTSQTTTTTAQQTTESTTAPTTQAPTTAAPTSAGHEHTWVADKKTVHHDAETRTVHHDAETQVVHHDAETTVIHHDEEGHYEEVQVLVSPAWDEEITEVHTVCKGCGFDYTANHYTEEQIDEHATAHLLNGENGGWKSAVVVVGTVHHDAVYTTEQQWIVDKAAWDETVVTKEAWDETVVVKAAWDETVTVKEAYDEEIITGYHCSGCGATK